MRRVLCYAVVASLLAASCSKSKEEIPTVLPMANSDGKIVIYQMMTRLFGNTVVINKPFGTIEENGVGKFNSISDIALKELREMGITHVWYTGVIEHAVLTDYTAYGIPLDDADVVKGRAGSPYAIKDYYDVNPDLAINVPDRMKEFEQLIARTHTNKLKVIIDFVPNHVARAYKSDSKPKGVKDLGEEDDTTVAFSPNNNFYYLLGESFQVPRGHKPVGSFNSFPTWDGKFEENPAKVTGNDQFTASPSINEWFETVKLNYGVDILNGRKTFFDPIPNTWIKMRDILLFWTSKKVDGFRCDMAEMVPVEFWKWVIPQVKERNPEILFIAEIYNPSQYQNYIETGSFDYLYDKVLLYDSLRNIINGKYSTAAIPGVQHALEGITHNMLHFLENHDEQRVASSFFAGDMWKANPALVISATIDRGPMMIYFGQEVGEPAIGAEGFSGEDGRTTIFDYWGVSEHQKWMNNGRFDGGLLSDNQKQLRSYYAQLLNLVRNNAAISHGNYQDITVSNQQAGNFNDKTHAFMRFAGEERLLILSSFNATPMSIKVTLPDDIVDKLGLTVGSAYTGKNLLGEEMEVKIKSDFSMVVETKPYSSYIFKIK